MVFQAALESQFLHWQHFRVLPAKYNTRHNKKHLLQPEPSTRASQRSESTRGAYIGPCIRKSGHRCSQTVARTMRVSLFLHLPIIPVSASFTSLAISWEASVYTPTSAQFSKGSFCWVGGWRSGLQKAHINYFYHEMRCWCSPEGGSLGRSLFHCYKGEGGGILMDKCLIERERRDSFRRLGFSISGAKPGEVLTMTVWKQRPRW